MIFLAIAILVVLGAFYWRVFAMILYAAVIVGAVVIAFTPPDTKCPAPSTTTQETLVP